MYVYQGLKVKLFYLLELKLKKVKVVILSLNENSYIEFKLNKIFGMVGV